MGESPEGKMLMAGCTSCPPLRMRKAKNLSPSFLALLSTIVVAASACDQASNLPPGLDQAGLGFGSGGDAGQTGPGPALTVTPDALVFDLVVPGTTASLDFQIRNARNTPVLLDELRFTGHARFEVRIQATDGALTSLKAGGITSLTIDPPIALAPGAVQAAQVIFAPTDNTVAKGVLVLGSDPKGQDPARLSVKGNDNLPCLAVGSPGGLHFGPVSLGSVSSKDATIHNCGELEAAITGVEVVEPDGTGGFGLKFDKTVAEHPTVGDSGPTVTAPLKLGPKDTATFSVVYTPKSQSPIDGKTGAAEPHRAKVRVHFGVGGLTEEMPCDGFGISDACPLAKVVVQEGPHVLPGTVLHLRGDPSMASAGATVAKYAWTVVQPAGSKQGFVPGPDVANPTFTTKYSGEHTFCLQVWDDGGLQSCNVTCATVWALPDAAVRVELRWTTPADPDPTDTGPGVGSDLDLHFAHPLAGGPDIDCDGEGDPWFSNPFDTFWFNPNPNWGSASPSVADDPVLDPDDSDGAGPELLTLGAPQGETDKPIAYDIGVHFWNDHGFGASFATVKVYVEGVLVADVGAVELSVLDMWYVGKLNWPSDKPGESLAPVKICHKTVGGDPCKKTGKFWQPQGDWCVTRCYVNPAFTATQSGASKSACKP